MADEQFRCLAELQNGEFCMTVVGAVGQRCAHHTRVGVRLCNATKKNGQLCSHKALRGMDTCGVHNPDKPPRLAPAPVAREGQHSCDCPVATGTRRGQRCGRLAADTLLSAGGDIIRRSCATHRAAMIRHNEMRVRRLNWHAIIDITIARVEAHNRHLWQTAMYHHMMQEPVTVGYDFVDEVRARQQAEQSMMGVYGVILEDMRARDAELAQAVRHIGGRVQHWNARQVLDRLERLGGRLDRRAAGTIGAFSLDTQNVHTSETRTMLQEATGILETVEETENSLELVRACFETRNFHDTATRTRIYQDMWHWYTTAYVSERNDFAYRKMLNKVWSVIQKSKHRSDLEERLFEEAYESVGMCAQGHISRLANVLQGFEETDAPVLEVPKGERLQTAMAQIAEMPEAEREAAARRVFAELDVGEADQEPWLEALMA